MLETSEKLTKITKGGFSFSGGYLIALLLQFIVGVIVIRYLKRSEYGIFALANIIISITVTLCSLGFGDGIPRFIGVSQKDPRHGINPVIVYTAITTVLIFTLLATVLIYLQAPFLKTFFNKTGLDSVLKTFAFMIIPLTIVRIITSIFRGTEKVAPKIFFQDLMTNISKIVLVAAVIALGAGFKGITWAYVLSAWLTLTSYLLYARKHLPVSKHYSFDSNFAKRLIFFSLPLMGAGLISNLLGWMGTLLLGFFSSADQIGLYSAPLRLASLISLPLTGLVFLYLPILRKRIGNISRTGMIKYYCSTTKWGFLGALCLLLYFLYDSRFIVTTIFGKEYLTSSDVLRIMAVGFSIHALMGPNGATLISLGHTGVIFSCTLFSGMVAFILCILLIPRYGAIGAALAMASARIISNIFLSLILYIKTRIHPFNLNFIKPIAISSVFVIILRVFLNPNNYSGLVFHIALFFVIFLTIIVAPFISRSLEETDIEILKTIERRIWQRTLITEKLSLYCRYS